MTLNIGGGFSLLRCASSMVSSLCCAMPPCYAPSGPPKIGQTAVKLVPILRNWGGGCNATKGTGTAEYGAFSRPCARATGVPGALDDRGPGRVKAHLCLDSGCLFAAG